MSHTVVESATYSASVTVPDPGEGVTAASIETAAQPLTNRTKYIHDRLLGEYFLINAYTNTNPDVAATEASYWRFSNNAAYDDGATVSAGNQPSVTITGALAGDLLLITLHTRVLPQSNSALFYSRIVTTENGGSANVITGSHRRMRDEWYAHTVARTVGTSGTAIAKLQGITNVGETMDLKGSMIFMVQQFRAF